MRAATYLLNLSIPSSTTVRSNSNGHHNPQRFIPSPFPTIQSPPVISPSPSPLFLRSMPPAPASSSAGGGRLTGGGVTELNSAVDFDAVASPDDGHLSIIGFGSLLSEKSARSTFPELKNFRLGVLRGFRRVFAHVSAFLFERGIANEQTKEMSSLSVEPCEDELLVVTVFEIKKEEVPSFIGREEEFRFLAVFPEGLDGVPFPNPAVVCARYSDEEYFQIRCQGSEETYYQRCGQYNIHKIWRDDILPCRLYLRHCVLAAKKLGEPAYSNFLDHTFLGDRKTTIREYLAAAGAGIMEEEPPESLKNRYGG